MRIATVLVTLYLFAGSASAQVPGSKVPHSTVAHMDSVLLWERQVLQAEDAVNSDTWDNSELGMAFKQRLANHHRMLESQARIVSHLQQGIGDLEDVFDFFVSAKDVASEAESVAEAEHSYGGQDPKYGQKGADILNAVTTLNVSLSAVQDDIRGLLRECK